MTEILAQHQIATFGNALQPEIEKPLMQPNAVERLAHSYDPEFWEGAEAGRTCPPGITGLSVARDEYGDMYDQRTQYLRNPEVTWLTRVYGGEVVPEGASVVEQPAHVKFGPLENITKFHLALNSGVLAGEGMRIATLTTPPFPAQSHNNRANNDLWLDLIRHNQWPIMLAQPSDADSPAYYLAHDSGDYHLGNMALFPKEVQDLITEAAIYEISWRKTHAGEGEPKTLLFAGEHDYDDDPWASGHRGSTSRGIDGIMKIDNISDDPYYMMLLAYLVEDKSVSCAQRLEQVQELAGDKEIDFADKRAQPYSALETMKKEIGDLVNFNSRHRDGAEASQELVDHHYQGFLTGVVRVAEKIRGNH